LSEKKEEGKEEGKAERLIKDMYDYGELKVLIKGFFLLDNNIRKLYGILKSNHKDVNIVIVNSNIVFGLEHVFGILRIIHTEMEIGKQREIKNFEIEFLLRICYTDQISNAFKILEDNKNYNFICILFSKSLCSVKDTYTQLKNLGIENNDLIQTSEAKKLHILEVFFKKDVKDSNNQFIKDDQKFQQFLIERSAISIIK
jgi:tRNA threonylcarbamoyladenosine modification (KEOPS) complex Cgi121 subunit